MAGAGLVGAEVQDLDIKFVGGQVEVSGKVVHQGKIGGAEIAVKANLDSKPFLFAAVDKLEELIPGDQKAIAVMLKGLIENAKF